MHKILKEWDDDCVWPPTKVTQNHLRALTYACLERATALSSDSYKSLLAQYHKLEYYTENQGSSKFFSLAIYTILNAMRSMSKYFFADEDIVFNDLLRYINMQEDSSDSSLLDRGLENNSYCFESRFATHSQSVLDILYKNPQYFKYCSLDDGEFCSYINDLKTVISGFTKRAIVYKRSPSVMSWYEFTEVPSGGGATSKLRAKYRYEYYEGGDPETETNILSYRTEEGNKYKKNYIDKEGQVSVSMKQTFFSNDSEEFESYDSISTMSNYPNKKGMYTNKISKNPLHIRRTYSYVNSEEYEKSEIHIYRSKNRSCTYENMPYINLTRLGYFNTLSEDEFPAKLSKIIGVFYLGDTGYTWQKKIEEKNGYNAVESGGEIVSKFIFNKNIIDMEPNNFYCRAMLPEISATEYIGNSFSITSDATNYADRYNAGRYEVAVTYERDYGFIIYGYPHVFHDYSDVFDLT